MTYRLFLSVFFCGVVLTLTSCSDPGGVGSDLGDRPAEDDSVATRTLAPDSLDTANAVSRTGFQQDDSSAPRAWRFLFGEVNDPLSGTMTAVGHIDFVGAAVRDSAFSAASADSLDAELRLRSTYVHGDTSSSIDVRLFDLTEEADMDGAPADTMFSTEMESISDGYQVSPTDSLLTFELPQSWIEEHQDVLQDSVEFGDAFNGLQLSPTDANVVIGVDHASATLRLTTSEDTADFQSLKSFTHLEQTEPPNAVLDGWTRIQDGDGQRLVMKWDFTDSLFTDTLRNNPLNKADVVVPIDTTKMKQERPMNDDFVRPTVNNYRMLGIREPDAPTCNQLGLRSFSVNNAICVLRMDAASSPGAARLAPRDAFAVFDRVLSEDTSPIVTSFQVEISVRENEVPRNTSERGLPSTLPVLIRTAENADIETRPRATITYTPL